MPLSDKANIIGGEGPKKRRARSVLFLCNLNSVRSPIAKSLLDRHSSRRIFADSAGLARGRSDPFVAAFMADMGYESVKHSPKLWDDIDPNSFDLIVALTAEAAAHVRSQGYDCEFWPTPDPTQTDGSRDIIMDAYRAVGVYLRERIARRFIF